MAKKKLIRDPRNPRLFTNEQLGLPPDDYEYREVVKTDEYGRKIRQRTVVKSKEAFIRQAREIWGDAYDYTESVYTDNKSPITIRCKKHDYYFTVPLAQNHIIKQHGNVKPTGCPYCSRENATPHNHRLLPGEREQREKEKAEQQRQRIEATANRLKKREEEKAQRRAAYEEKLRLQHEETLRRREAKKADKNLKLLKRKQQRIADLQVHFRKEAPKKQGGGYIYKGIEQITSKSSKVLVHCPNPDHEWHPMLVSLILQGCKCRECAGRHQPVEQRCQEWIAKCIEKYGEGRYDYSRAHEDYVNNDSLVWIRCCIHDHWFRQTPDNNLRTVNGSCPICTAEFIESQGEANIRRWLMKHGIVNFKQDEVMLPNENPKCKRLFLRPDFWLPDYNLFIEYNGEEHYRDIDFFFDEDFTFEDEQIRDETMRQYCRDHHHNLLEIPYTDFDRIGEILSDILLEGKTNYSTYYVF